MMGLGGLISEVESFGFYPIMEVTKIHRGIRRPQGEPVLIIIESLPRFGQLGTSVHSEPRNQSQ